MNRSLISRRALLVSSAAAAVGCSRPKAERFLGFCFVANHDGRSIGVVDLTRFKTRQQIPPSMRHRRRFSRARKPTRPTRSPRPTAPIYELDASLLSITRRVKAGNDAVSMRLSRARRCPLGPLSLTPPASSRSPSTPSVPVAAFASIPRPTILISAAKPTRLASSAATIIRSPSFRSPSPPSRRTNRAATELTLARFRLDGRLLIAGSKPDRSLTFYDVPTGKTVVRLPLALAPREFCFTNDGGQLYVTGDGMDAVVSVFPYRTEVWETLLAGHAPGVMVTAEPDKPPFYLLVANPEADTVTVLDVETGKAGGPGDRRQPAAPDRYLYRPTASTRSFSMKSPAIWRSSAFFRWAEIRWAVIASSAINRRPSSP